VVVVEEAAGAVVLDAVGTVVVVDPVSEPPVVGGVAGVAGVVEDPAGAVGMLAGGGVDDASRGRMRKITSAVTTRTAAAAPIARHSSPRLLCDFQSAAAPRLLGVRRLLIAS
jgi:hypothetical protein